MTETPIKASLERLEDALLHKQDGPRAMLELLLARDAVEDALADRPSAEDLADLVALDKRLRDALPEVAAQAELPRWRQTVRPPESHWWWHAQAHPDRGDRLDWLWHALTAAVLGLAASFTVSILQAMSVNGISWSETFSVLAQGAGLTLLGKGALTRGGQSRISGFLDRFGIPGRFHAEAMLLASALVCVLTWQAHERWLPAHFQAVGKAAYQRGDLERAQEEYQKALRLADDPTLYMDLGKVYESLHDLDGAMVQYRQALRSGTPGAFNDLGRAYLYWTHPRTGKKKLDLAEALLRLGLQRVAGSHAAHAHMRYQLHRNLGWALLEQDRFEEARVELEQALQIRSGLPRTQSRMAECLLMEVYRGLGDPARARQHRGLCLENGRPETIDEYEWLIKHDARDVARCIDTTYIVAGGDSSPCGSDAAHEAAPSDAADGL